MSVLGSRRLLEYFATESLIEMCNGQTQKQRDLGGDQLWVEVEGEAS